MNPQSPFLHRQTLLLVVPMPSHASLRLAQQSRSNVPHVCFLELVILPIVPVDVDEFESFHHPIDVEAHIHKSVDEVFIIALVSMPLLAPLKHKHIGCLPSQLLLSRSLHLLLRCCGSLSSAALPTYVLRGIGVLDGPFPSYLLELCWVIHQHARHLCILRVFGFRRAEERLEGEEGGFDGKDGRPSCA
jgi:hypothetical protein